MIRSTIRRPRRTAARATVLATAAVALTLPWTASSASASTFGDTTFAAPRLTYLNGVLYTSWTGTDDQGHVNIGQVGFTTDPDHLSMTGTTVNDTALATTGPALTGATIGGSTQLLVAWAGTDSAHHIYLGRYHGTNTLDCHTQVPESTDFSPYLVGVSSNVYLAWTGADPAHHINIALLNTNSCPDHVTLQNVVTLNDTAIGGPAMTIYNGSLYVAWAGTDAQKHIYLGRFTGGPSLANHTCLCNLAAVSDLGMSANDAGAVTITYDGTDGRVYLAHLKNGTTLYSNQTDGSNATLRGGDVTDVPVNNGHYPGGQYNSFNGTDQHININHHTYELPPPS